MEEASIEGTPPRERRKDVRTPLEGQAIADARLILATYKAKKKESPLPKRVSTSRPLSSLGNKARELEHLIEQAEHITRELRAATHVTPARTRELSEDAVLELTRALARAATARDNTVSALDDENRLLRTENTDLRNRIAQYQRQLDELALSFDSLLLCLDYQPLSQAKDGVSSRRPGDRED